MVVNLIRATRSNPSDAELALMKKVEVKDLRLFYDAMASGQDEKLTYQQFLDHIYGRPLTKALGKGPAPAPKQSAPAPAPKQAAPAPAPAPPAPAPAPKAPAASNGPPPGSAGKCAQCNRWIEDKAYLENGDLKLHDKCLEAWQLANSPKCGHCKKPILDECVELTTSGVAHSLHPSCVDEFKKATRPKCAKCGLTIMENTRVTLGADNFHVACSPKKP